MADLKTALPPGLYVDLRNDRSEIYRQRLDLMIRNGTLGLGLVFLLLALFLELRLAFWVSLGVPISFLGAVWMMPTLDVSVNQMSLFAFIVVLGIVVDDAIIVGENVYSHYQRHGNRLKAAIDGAREVSVPVVFAVLTTVATFMPLLAVEGGIGKTMRVIPLIVIPARYASTRYPGKPLVPLTGATGETKTLVERSWDAAKAVAGSRSSASWQRSAFLILIRLFIKPLGVVPGKTFEPGTVAKIDGKQIREVALEFVDVDLGNGHLVS